MPGDTSSTGIGATLRESREAQGRSLEDAALALRARASQLQALEEEAFDAFGGDVYAKGFLRSYAVELGLDPAPLLDIFRREVSHDDVHAASLVGDVSAPKERRSPPAWIAWLLAAVVVVAGLAVLGSTDGRSPDQASPDESVGTPPISAEGDAPDAPTDDGVDEQDGSDEGAGDDDGADPEEEVDDTVDEAEEEEEEVFEGVELFLAFESASWIRVVADDTPVVEQTVAAGETLQFDAQQEIEIRFGNPGGVRATLNGEDLGTQGDPGIPLTVRYTPEGRTEA